MSGGGAKPGAALSVSQFVAARKLRREERRAANRAEHPQAPAAEPGDEPLRRLFITDALRHFVVRKNYDGVSPAVGMLHQEETDASAAKFLRDSTEGRQSRRWSTSRVRSSRRTISRRTAPTSTTIGRTETNDIMRSEFKQ